jgi:hypothetical protein
MAQWRSQHDVDAVLSESFPERTAMLQAYPQWHHKTDRWGRPVWFELPGRIDVDALLKVCWLLCVGAARAHVCHGVAASHRALR